MQAPRKPWEKRQEAAGDGAGPSEEGNEDEQGRGHASSALLQDILDQEFPPVENDGDRKEEEEKSSTVT